MILETLVNNCLGKLSWWTLLEHLLDGALSSETRSGRSAGELCRGSFLGNSLRRPLENYVGELSWKSLLGNYLKTSRGKLPWETLVEPSLGTHDWQTFFGNSLAKPSWNALLEKNVRGIRGNSLGSLTTLLGNSLGTASWSTILENSLGKLSLNTILENMLGNYLGTTLGKQDQE